MENTNCSHCQNRKATLKCGICEAALCKNCVEFLEPDVFSFLDTLKPELSHTTYCPSCYEEQVIPELNSYNELLDRARQVFIFFIAQRTGIPILSRSKETISVKNCLDRDEAILRIGFAAAKRSMNAVVDVEILSEQVRNEGYQKLKWHCTGHPAQIDEAKLKRQEARGSY